MLAAHSLRRSALHLLRAGGISVPCPAWTAPLASATEQRCACAFDAAARRGFAGKASADASAVATQEAVPSPPPQPQPLAFAARASTDDWMQLGERDVGKFLSFSAEDEARLLPEGCAALRAEFEASGTRLLLVRESFLRARARVLAPAPGAKGSRCLVLDGPSGAGKSVLLAQLVAAARSSGQLALYVPRGRSLAVDSLFYRHEASTPPAWDTPDHARALLSSLATAHPDLMDTLMQKRADAPPNTPLRALITAGTASNALPSVAVDAALQMLAELALVTDVRVLIAVDELNALSSWSEYHEVTGPRSRRRLAAEELRIAASLRAFDGGHMARGCRVGATSASAGVSPRVHVACLPRGARRAVPRLSRAEAEAMVGLYASSGASPLLQEAQCALSIAEVAKKLHAITVGNGAGLRSAATFV